MQHMLIPDIIFVSAVEQPNVTLIWRLRIVNMFM